MAIFHFTVKIVSRGKGQSAVAKAAYNSRSQLENENTGEKHDYRKQGEVLFSGIFAPKNAPEWAHDRQALWSAVEKKENRKNSQLAREIEIGLPHELTEKQRENLIKDFVRENFVRKGLIADVVLHPPDKDGDERNYHAHVLLTMRDIGPEGFGAKRRDLNSKAQLEDWREKWEKIANRYLERFGHEARIDHRTLEEQGIDREPTTHIGPTATQLEREGIKTERGGINREIKERNQQRETLLEQHAESVRDFQEHREAAKLEHEAERLEAAQDRAEAVAESATSKEQSRQIERDADKGLKIASNLVSGLAKGLDAALDLVLGAPPETPETKRAKIANLEQQAEKAAEEATKPPPRTPEELEKSLFERRFKSSAKSDRERDYDFEREREQ